MDKGDANSDTHPYINLELRGGTEKGSVQLDDLSGDQFEPAKGDLWEFEIDKFGFSEPCISSTVITRVNIETDGNYDGLGIANMFTIYTPQWCRKRASDCRLQSQQVCGRRCTRA